MPRNGKIARLPREIRNELNRRMEDGAQGGALLRWLNELPLVQALVIREFDGVAISKQNLSEWRAGGFAEWQGRQEMLEQSRELAADAREIAAATDGTLADHLATILAARYAAALSGWNGEADENFRRKVRVLRGLSQDIVQLRRSDHSAARVKIRQDRLALTKEKTDAELMALFKEWLQKPEVRNLVSQKSLSHEESERRWREIFGLEPEPEKSPEEAAVERENRWRTIFGMEQLPLPPRAGAQETTAGNGADTAQTGAQTRPSAQPESGQVKVGQTKSKPLHQEEPEPIINLPEKPQVVEELAVEPQPNPAPTLILQPESNPDDNLAPLNLADHWAEAPEDPVAAVAQILDLMHRHLIPYDKERLQRLYAKLPAGYPTDHLW